MPKTGLVLDERFERHDTGPQHPECAARLPAIRTALVETGLAEQCQPIEPRPIELAELHRIHQPEYVRRVQDACRRGVPFIDVPDSAICPESYEIALLAAGATLEAVDAVIAGRVQNAFCAVRPPGHHAERDRSMGFCLFNNIALAADRLLRHHGLERVLVVDWDVHHCNGTQHTFEATQEVFVCSLHGYPGWVYPGTGFASETGTGQGQGYTLNLPMIPQAGGEEYRRAFVEKLLPAAEAYRPQFVLVSAGFDAHRQDPLAPICLETSDYDWMTRWAMDLAQRHCDGRLVSVLEGGYDLSALSDCVKTHLALLMNYGSETSAAGHESGVW
ncbi:MAG: histone deacetylase family protein [Planctomycetota bacterium]|jgi:acetoin utilization deacetylase AcuC-like enzyme